MSKNGMEHVHGENRPILIDTDRRDGDVRTLPVLSMTLTEMSRPEPAEGEGETAARHVANIFAKLDVSTRAQAVAFAHQHGLV